MKDQIPIFEVQKLFTESMMNLCGRRCLNWTWILCGMVLSAILFGVTVRAQEANATDPPPGTTGNAVSLRFIGDRDAGGNPVRVGKANGVCLTHLDAPDRVASGRCRPEAPTDPYLLALEHTVPQIMGSLPSGTQCCYPFLFR